MYERRKVEDKGRCPGFWVPCSSEADVLACFVLRFDSFHFVMLCENGAFSRGRSCRRDKLPVPDALEGSLTADRAEQCSFLDLARC